MATILPRIPFHEQFFHRFTHPSCIEVIAIKFCTWHASCAVVVCAKFCIDGVAYNGITIKPIFNRIWIGKIIREMGPDLNDFTQWGRVTYITSVNYARNGSDNDLPPIRHQTIMPTNAGLLWIKQWNFLWRSNVTRQENACRLQWRPSRFGLMF